METREGDLNFDTSTWVTITYPEIRHVSVSILARNLQAGDTFFLTVQLPTTERSIIFNDEEFHHLEFDTKECKIKVGLLTLDHTVNVVYYATETYVE